MTQRCEVLIVGGGLSGLVRAHELKKKGVDVRVVESASQPGGVMRTIRKDGFLLELGPNTVRPTPGILSLCREVGLEAEMRLSDPRLPRYVEIGGTLRKLPFGVLSPGTMLRAIAEIAIPGRQGSGEESLFEFIRRRFGRRIAEDLLEPFVSGIFAGDARKLSAAAAFPKLVEWERSHGSVLRGMISSRPGGPKTEKVRGLLSFREGLSTLPLALARALGDRFLAGVRLENLERGADGWRAATASSALIADRVVLAVPAAEAARLCRPFAPEAASALDAIPSPPLVVAHCAWPRAKVGHPLVGFGYLVKPAEGRRILGAVWSSALFAGRAPEGKVLLTIFLGGRRKPEGAEIPDEGLAAAIDSETRSSLATREAPEIVHVQRYDRAIPQYEAGHAERIERLAQAERAWPGLRLIGNYRGGISVGDVAANAAIITSS
jgi:oxygen-dependent protoporphyrinogen oxidase